VGIVNQQTSLGIGVAQTVATSHFWEGNWSFYIFIIFICPDFPSNVSGVLGATLMKQCPDDQPGAGI